MLVCKFLMMEILKSLNLIRHCKEWGDQGNKWWLSPYLAHFHESLNDFTPKVYFARWQIRRMPTKDIINLQT